MSSRKITTVIFDLDGTLLDTLEDLKNATNHALRVCGMPERTLGEIRQFVGNGVRNLMVRAVPQGRKTLDLSVPLRSSRNITGSTATMRRGRMTAYQRYCRN